MSTEDEAAKLNSERVKTEELERKIRLEEWKEVNNIYNIYRGYIAFEANLVSSRITWVLTMNGFLFAAFGVIYTKDPPADGWKILILFFVALAGIVVDCLGFFLIRYAQQANCGVESAFISMIREEDIKKLDSSFHRVANGKHIFELCDTQNTKNSPSQYFLRRHSGDNFRSLRYNGNIVYPGIRGGGSAQSVRFSYLFSQLIPLSLAILWGVLGAISASLPYPSSTVGGLASVRLLASSLPHKSYSTPLPLR